LIRDIRPRCALAAAAHVAMMIDVECRRDQKLSVDLKTQQTQGRSRCPVSRVRKRRLDPA
jgi:hypothetical protein